MKKALLSEIITSFLILLFVYSSFSKLLDFAAFQRAMHSQPFPTWLASLLTWLIPSLELIVVVLLLLKSTRLAGLSAFLVLMIFFTGYILAILLGLFNTVPCSCGGIIQSLSWGQHLVFNLIFIAMAFFDIKLWNDLS
ncbi:MauE/DoxX family redox-associated membrane protein [Mucilaginibacter jinjuensis]|uniref:Methylamine utilisation protein MauE domain-containing protein n=1 Tax=Mucilaginibacter jinjuensis TaxID=1176721 RepID=A0ABY7TCM6_9SPHI|nr:MauE/DoxX family redox-associated membrane protein [Mucilaginibacter jinjuensis]WCT13463.1 hypothetical protein PQO05_05885 [Mucilaginibacter jinjuensis]